MKREDVIDRIKKLMAMTTERGASENEAVQAALMAQRLIADYDVQKNELHDTVKEIVEEIKSEFATTGSFGIRLARVIADNFRCKYYIKKERGSKRRPVFMGYETDAMAAKLTYEALYRVMNRGAKRARREQKETYGFTDGAYGSFACGFIDGVRQELEIKCQALMLVTPSEVEEAYQERTADFSEFKPRRILVNDIYTDQGVSAGRDAVRGHRMNGQLALA